MAHARFETLFDFARHRANIRIECGKCDHWLSVHPSQMADAFGWTRRIDDVEARLVCSECGGRRARLKPVPKGDPRLALRAIDPPPRKPNR